ncbi:tRNA-splicing endonuclease-like protein subunit sen34 [Plenodomus tracheiphilus IPT5]|uniref:tRNA-splicing endonuclease subunit Sen34 n=1 Tax=Plenodomus tracheiphilus IPT5 TaxID=1408161 RepID=A0A6A7BJI5_9PLEO|nr:tRNA-splicing endonuclease-like protein subunit sen34 [Plenodomus tracheiphilus IPT5]
MAPAPAPSPVTEPFPISCIAGRYLLFDVDIISHCRRAHNICGILIGTIPNLSQQNVFLGIPLELMPEEARVLVERGAAYVVDDVEVHQQGFKEMSRADRLKYLQEMDRAGEDVARQHLDKAEQRKDKALKEKGLRKEVLEKESSPAENTVTEETVNVDTLSDTSSDLGFIMKGSSFSDSTLGSKQSQVQPEASETTLFESAPASPAPFTPSNLQKPVSVQKHYVTPTTSYPPLPIPTPDTSRPLPAVPNSYPLFRYLHSKGYFHMPGIRFGCHYNVYPGDPLRYHSHFAATGLAWDEEFDLLDVVGGGRLGTGTKKAYMIGGEDPEGKAEGVDLFRTDVEDVKIKQPVRAFSVEWAAI